MTADRPDPAEGHEAATTPEAPASHTDEGLDLARALTRATTGARAETRARRRRRPDTATATDQASGRSSRGGLSSAHPDERDPQPLDTTVERVVADRGWELELRVHGVFARWPDLVGPEVGSHSRPESFVDGTLVVRTDSTAWATQLRLLAPTVVRRLNEELGDGTVKVLEVVGPRVPSWTKGRRSTRDGRGPRDTYG